MIRENYALKSRTETSTFLTYGESESVDGGILGGLALADEEIKRRGANTSANTIAADTTSHKAKCKLKR